MILDIYSYVKEVFMCLVMDTSLLLTWFCLMSCASATQIYMCSSVGTQELTGFCNRYNFWMVQYLWSLNIIISVILRNVANNKSSGCDNSSSMKS